MSEAAWEGLGAGALARRLSVPEVVLLERVTSTMDVAHDCAARGAAAGTVMLADMQDAGRGRAGRRWISRSGQGVWLTLLERPETADGLNVLSLRAGLRVAAALDRFTVAPLEVKWPNDLFAGGGKVAGVLIETRWREERVEWVAIGCGINVRSAPVEGAAALGAAVSRLEVLDAVVPALRSAALDAGPLRESELREWRRRDTTVGRRIREPAAGEVVGITADGALLVRGATGVSRCASGSLVLAEGG